MMIGHNPAPATHPNRITAPPHPKTWRRRALLIAFIACVTSPAAKAEHNTLTTSKFTFDPATDVAPLPPGAPRGGSFDIVINAGAGLGGNAAALAAIERAAAQWEAYITDPITVTIEADLTNLGNNGVPGSTDLVMLGFTDYAIVRTAWINDADIDDGILSSLPTQAQLAITLPGGYTLLPGLAVSKANLKAIGGFGNLDAQFGAADGTITFNSGYPYDYNNANGVGVNLIDFETIAAHEIGHVLGFVSSVDTVDEGVETDIQPTAMDMFRFKNSLSNTTIDPDTAGQFATATRDLTVNPNPISEFITGVGAEDVENRMSTGKFTGDGNQASHWKSDNLTGVRIGMMEPTIGNQEIFTITDADLRMLDLIGYDIEFATPITDCNGNAIDDATDIANGASDDCNGNSIPDECELPERLDQVNTPEWQGHWVNIQAAGVSEQTFQPQMPWLLAVEVGLTDIPFDSGSDTITVELWRGAAMLSSASTLVTEPFEGLARFDFPSAVAVTPGETLSLFINGSPNFLVFGLQFAPGDTYPNGQRLFNGTPENDDWIFRTIGAYDLNATGEDCNLNGFLDSCELAGFTTSVEDTPNVAIPDNDPAGVTSTITVAGSGYISDLNVGLYIQHTYQGDIIATLSHGGVAVDLINRAGSSLWSCNNGLTGYAANNFGTSNDMLVLDDGAAVLIDCYGGPNGAIGNYVGPAMPHEPLAAFNGLNMAGEWTLTVSDHAINDIGTLVSWSLDFTTSGFDCNGNGVLDTCEIASNDCNANGVLDECEFPEYIEFAEAFPNSAIPNNSFGGTSTTINIPTGGTILDLDLGVHVQHQDQGEVDVRVSHGGVTVVAVRGPGRSEWGCTAIVCGYSASNLGSADNRLILDDAAGVSIDCYAGDSNGTSNYAGPAIPHDPLSAFNGMDMSGDWTITAADRCAGGSGGTFVSCSLAFRYTLDDCDADGVPNACEADTDGDGVPDDCDPCPTRATGDLTGDGFIDDFDVSTFSTVLLNPSAATPDELCAADMNRDGAVDGLDLQGFVEVLTAP